MVIFKRPSPASVLRSGATLCSAAHTPVLIVPTDCCRATLIVCCAGGPPYLMAPFNSLARLTHSDAIPGFNEAAPGG